MYIKSVLSWTAFGLKVTVRIKTDMQIVLLDNKGRYFNHGLMSGIAYFQFVHRWGILYAYRKKDDNF